MDLWTYGLMGEWNMVLSRKCAIYGEYGTCQDGSLSYTVIVRINVDDISMWILILTVLMSLSKDDMVHTEWSL